MWTMARGKGPAPMPFSGTEAECQKLTPALSKEIQSAFILPLREDPEY